MLVSANLIDMGELEIQSFIRKCDRLGFLIHTEGSYCKIKDKETKLSGHILDDLVVRLEKALFECDTAKCTYSFCDWRFDDDQACVRLALYRADERGDETRIGYASFGYDAIRSADFTGLLRCCVVMMLRKLKLDG